MGRALWMVSVSINGMPRSLWTPDAERLVSRVIQRVLEGCGDPATDNVQQGALTTLVRRQCTLRERLQVREPYLPPELQHERG